MVVVEHDDDAGGLGVEGAGDVFDGVLDEFFDTGVGDGGGGGELIEGAAGGDEGEEGGVGGRHCG